MIRRATAGDLSAIRRIQQACPEAAQWTPADHPTLVAEVDSIVCGFLIWLDLKNSEVEILNLAVDPAYRRRGIGRSLVLRLAQYPVQVIFLEVRESNQAARRFYQALGFQQVGIREGYYQNPPEAAVVMKWAS